MTADLVVRGARQVWTCAGPAPRRGRAQREAGVLPDATVASLEGRIVFVGPTDTWDRVGTLADGGRLIDASGHIVLPGFVDPHTHAVYAGDRREELRRRLAGATYAEIAAEGGGILRTVEATRAATEDDLAAQTRPRLDAMLRAGTTTAEVKSGYGLTVDAELKMLGVIRRLAREQPIELVPTFMGAHEISPEYRDRRAQYVDLVIQRMIPAVAQERLAEWCDVFCERGVFTPEEAHDILSAGLRAGLKPRIHAEELAASGGARVATEIGARSADHLIHVGREAAEALARADVMATLLPSAAFYLKLGRYAPARMLIDTGVGVALATDMNPGGGFSPSMPFVMTLACFAMQMTFEEALVAATINAAYAIDRHTIIGSLEAGKQMDAVIVRGEAADLLAVGHMPIAAVIKRGRLVVS